MTIRSVLLTTLGALALVGGTAGFAALSSPVQAQAQSASAKAIVDQAVANGIIGETAAGYLAIVDSSASVDVVNAMNEVNGGRKTVYTRLAREQNVQINVVAALTGEKQLAKAAPGEKIMTKEGRWITVR